MYQNVIIDLIVWRLFMKVNDIIHGFRVDRVRHLDEIKGDLYEMIHVKTGARTIWLNREDENKTFYIGFKTTPVDDTGVFHILEHSVLNGSKKYPVREPFVDLLKGSLQTFLNAMTYPDKTVYPISSRNNKDFVNLMRVYLDAVFYPNVLKNPNVFYQEGWHYELNEEDGEPIYKGVVFNEMKGAFSSPDGVKGRELMHALFPDSCYGNESGGDPDHITDLTYEQFCDAHRRFYSPSNSYIFLDGDMDIEEVLGIIDEEYLSNFDDSGERITITKQKSVRSDTVVKEYEISEEMSPEGKAQISYGYVFGDFDEYEKIAAFSLISSVLCGNNESPLKKVILNNGLGEDISFDVQDGLYQPFAVIDVINTDLEKEEEISKKIREELEKQVREGLDKEELEANLNQREFKARERDFGGMPKGLVFGLSALDSWLYGGDPVDSICFGDLFDSLREKIHTSYYEDLIRDYILNSEHKAKLLLKPSNTLGEQKRENERKKLQAIAEKWSQDDRKDLVELNRNLQTWQASEDTPEQKATLPALHLEDLKKEPTEYPLRTSEYEGHTVLLHDQDSNGISYVNLYAEVNDLQMRDYTVLVLMLSLLGKLKTQNYDVLTLNRKMKSVLGDFNTGLSPFLTYHERKQRNLVSVYWSDLCRNDEEALDLIEEILYRTDFSDAQAIRDILKQNLFTLEQSFLNAGHALAVQRASSYDSPVAAVSEYAGGYEAYRYLKDLDENWEEKKEGFLKELVSLYERVFLKERYTLSVTGEHKDEITRRVFANAPLGAVGEDTVKEALGHRREGIVVPSNVSYAAKSFGLGDEIKNIGVMYVLSNILTYDYLWNNVRVKNGAYGCGMRSGYGRRVSFYSYRDPDPGKSLEIFRDTVDYLKEFTEKQNSIENYIVGTTGDFDPYMSLKVSLRSSDAECLGGLTSEDKKAILDQILNADLSALKDAIPLFEKVNEADNICVIGNKGAITKASDCFDEIFDLNQKR